MTGAASPQNVGTAMQPSSGQHSASAQLTGPSEGGGGGPRGRGPAYRSPVAISSAQVFGFFSAPPVFDGSTEGTAVAAGLAVVLAAGLWLSRSTRWRLARIRRSYRRVARIELKLRKRDDQLAAARLRRDFAAETVAIIDQGQQRWGWSRRERRQFKRGLVK